VVLPEHVPNSKIVEADFARTHNIQASVRFVDAKEPASPINNVSVLMDGPNSFEANIGSISNASINSTGLLSKKGRPFRLRRYRNAKERENNNRIINISNIIVSSNIILL